MAGQGRHPKPARLRAISGGVDKRTPKDAVAVAPLVSIPPLPAAIKDDADAVESWEWVTKNMAECGYLNDLDLHMLLFYCQIYSRTIQAEKLLRSSNMVYKTTSGYPIPNPYLSIYNKGVEQMNKLGLQFGWSPVARARLDTDQLVLPLGDGDEPDNFARMMAATAG